MSEASSLGDVPAANVNRADEVRTYVETLITSPAFATSQRRGKFLRYVVERTLAGEGAQISEYGIGLDVFDKSAAFDPRFESIVRTELSRLRQKLKDYYSREGSADPIIIEFPQRSYVPSFRFAEPVPPSVTPQVEADQIQAYSPAATPPRKPKRLGRGVLVVLGVAALILAVIALWRYRPTPPLHSLVVLPFQNLSANQSNEYLALGLTEELTNEMGQWSDVRVVASTSASQFQGKNMDLREIGRKLNVDAAIEGSIARQGDRLRITAQLNRTADGYNLWSRAYDTDLSDLLTVQQEVARSVAAVIHRGGRDVVETKPTVPTSSPEALDLYLQASFAYSQFTPDSVKKSIALFRAALGKDPNFARAYIGIAAGEIDLSALTLQSPLAGQARARAALRKALDIEPRSADAYGMLADLDFVSDWNTAGAEQDFRLALQQGARSGIRSNFAWFLATQGRFSEAHAQARIAEYSDPLGAGPRSSQFWAYYFEHNYREAQKTLRGMLVLNPDSMYAHALLGLVAAIEKDCGESSRQFQWTARKYQLPMVKCGLAYASACSGDTARARQYLKEAEAAVGPMYASPYQLALGYAFIHDKENAILFLRKAAANREGQIHYLKYEPVFDEIRFDPRYVALEAMVR